VEDEKKGPRDEALSLRSLLSRLKGLETFLNDRIRFQASDQDAFRPVVLISVIPVLHSLFQDGDDLSLRERVERHS
jgi:hypothetical protein